MTSIVPPFPVIVGVPRSGTTMLRFMLDSHPELAIPPETGFLMEPSVRNAGDPVRIVAAMMRFPEDAPAWPDFGVDADELLAAVAADAGVRDVLRQFYQLYASRHGKARPGDKTPGYLAHMRTVAAVLPEARFIHILRDGRDVALSWSRTWFAPTRNLPELVERWASMVRQGRDAASDLHYLEIRYEDLVRDPGRELQIICDFLDLDYRDEMLDFHERSAARLVEHRDRFRADGSLLVSHSDRLKQQQCAMSPPQPERVQAWRQEMSAAQAALCELAAGGLLASFDLKR